MQGQYLRAVIADDEPLSLSRLARSLEYLTDVLIIGAAADGPEALAMIRDQRPDLAILDIDMPGLSGLEVIRQVAAQHAPVVIFVTAHEAFATAAFDENAADYLVKPFEPERLKLAVDRARTLLEARDSHQRIEELRRTVASLHAREDSGARAEFDDHIWIKGRKGQVRINISDVTWLSAESEYIRVHTAERSYLLRGSLKEFASRLDPRQFMRIHRGALVRIDQIQSIAARGGSTKRAMLTDGTEVPISRTHERMLIDTLARAAS